MKTLSSQVFSTEGVTSMNQNRRNFIKSGSLLFTIPFVEALPSLGFAASASGSLKRVLFFNLSQSWAQDQIFPTATNYSVGPEGVRYIPLNSFSGDISKLFTASKYAGIKSKMNIMRGFDCVKTDILGGGGHNKGLAMSACFENASNMQLKTIDHVIAESPGFYPTTPHRKVFSAIAAKGNFSWRYSNSFNLTKPIADLIGAGACYTNAEGTKEIFSDLFSTPLPSGSTAPVDSNLSRRIALNNALSKLNLLSKNTKISKHGQQTFTQHADFINQILPSIAPPSGSSSGLSGTCLKPTLDTAINDSELSTSNNGKRLRACLDMIYMAFNCQLTNVVSFFPMIAADNENAAMGDDVGIYHENVGHKYNPEYYLAHKGFLFDNLMYLVNLMDSTKESNGLSMLDNSLIVVVSDDGCATHSYRDLGAITFGSLGGTIKTGNFINFQRTDAPLIDGGSDNGRYFYNLGRPYNSLFTTILNALKISNSGFGIYPTSSTNYAPFITASAKAASLPILS